jgi:DNA-binding transcriptional ArsR family regulator
MAPPTELPPSEIVDPEAVRRIQDHPIDADMTAQVAEIFKALADPTRVRILHALLHAELCVGDLATVLEMSESAVSHQLRLLRHLGLVVGHRDGRRIVYDLYDDHVGELLEQAISHVEHVRAGLARRASSRATATA